MHDVETRADLGSRKPLDVWRLGVDEDMDPQEADRLIHFLQARATERLRMAEGDVAEAERQLKRAQRQLGSEKKACAAFLTDEKYAKATIGEVLRDSFPERFTEGA